HWFQAVLEPNCQAFSLPSEVEVRYEALSGTTSSLRSVKNLALVHGQAGTGVELLDFDTFAPFDPDQYQLTLVDGRVLDIDQAQGLTRMTDLNGNSIEVTQDGLIHSAGKSVTFTRDAQGRITLIDAPGDRNVEYGYTAAGDLSTSTDPSSNTSRFSYDG